MVISEDARRIQVKVYEILAASYVLQIDKTMLRDPQAHQAAIQVALTRAGNESAMAAAYFDRRFPSHPTIDVPQTPEKERSVDHVQQQET